jgi:hypothetical protein
MYSNKRAHKTTHCTKKSENFLVIFCGNFLPLLNKMAIPIKGGGRREIPPNFTCVLQLPRGMHRIYTFFTNRQGTTVIPPPRAGFYIGMGKALEILLEGSSAFSHAGPSSFPSSASLPARFVVAAN